MKKEVIIKIMAQDFGVTDVNELNKALKASAAQSFKYKITGKKVGHLGFTGLVKNIVPDGLKVFDVNKVKLIKFMDIEKFEKAKPKVPRSEVPKKTMSSKKVDEKNEPSEKRNFLTEDEPKTEKFRKKAAGKEGSSFIPKARSKT